MDPDEDDPELAALLDFEPVPRRVERENGWSAENQRAFIAGLVETGNYRLAAQRLGLTASGVYQLRKDAGAEDFARAWDEAVALHKTRNPRAAPRAAREVRAAGTRRAAEIDPAERDAAMDEILRKYWRKLKDERHSRLAGRIVEADFYVRQLSFIEIALELGGKAMAVLNTLKAGEVPLLTVNATPMSTMLEKLRRALWQEQGEADRPPPAKLGTHDGAVSTGIPTHFRPERDGDYAEWVRRREKARAVEAEAQAAWEERARREADPSTSSGQGAGEDSGEERP